mgnify:FL=1
MDTATLPEIIIPDLKKDPEELLLSEETIYVGQDIPNADAIIDNIISDFKSSDSDTTWLHAVKEFSHAEKVNWILSLPDTDRNLGCLGTLAYVTVYITVMIMVAIDAAGDPVYKKEVVPKQVQKCVPKK